MWRVLLAAALTVDIFAVEAQDLYLVMPDYNNITLSPQRIAKIPGVSAVNADNTTLDENNRRFFFLGNRSADGGEALYTLDAVTGKVLSSPDCPSNIPDARVYGLHYDNATNTLYGLCSYFNGLTIDAAFCRIDPSTGVLYPIPGSGPICCGASTYDQTNHLYIYNSFYGIFTIDVSSGVEHLLPSKLVYPDPNLLFDNKSGAILAIGSSSPFGTNNIFQALTSFNPITGIEGLLTVWGWPTAVPVAPFGESFGVNGTGGIDESRGAYFFTAAIDPDSSHCPRDLYFFVVDRSSGKIRSAGNYPYGLKTAPVQGQDQLIGFSFDNRRHLLYALNWHSPANSTGSGVSIHASVNPICPGDPVIFSSNPVGAGISPSFHWLVNGIDAATDSLYSDPDPQNNDTVVCILTTDHVCSINYRDTSDAVILHIRPPASVTIGVTDSVICSGDIVRFESNAMNAGPRATVSWLINGVAVDSPGTFYSTKDLTDGDLISCLLYGSYCRRQIPSSDTIRMTVNPTPQLTMEPDITLLPGQSITLAPVITGAGVISYQWSPAGGLNSATAPEVIASPDISTTYQLTVSTDKGCSDSGKTTIFIYSTLQMPAAFTPNHDGKNDLFRIPPSKPQKITGFAVYDRWGKRVFLTRNSAEGWDGNYNGQPQPAGTYAWQIEYEDRVTGRLANAAGTVILIR